MEKVKKKILIITGRYLPGTKDGGPVRSIKNLTDYLGDEYEFRILTCDRDHGDLLPYTGIIRNNWNVVGKAKVYYVPPKGFTFSIIKTLASQVDLLYICGCFNDYSINSLILNRIKQIKKPVVIAAMGLFSPMEFQLKYWKKKLFISIFNWMGMFQNIYWSATSTLEISEICKQIHTKKSQFFVAEDLPRIVDAAPVYKTKEKGRLRIVWISRITPKKNLYQSIRILSKVKADIEFTVYGPIHDLRYWNKCKIALKKLPTNIQWSFGGNVASEEVIQTLKQYHVFLFPTLGENYGHVIQEALSAGCAVILSDQTPWHDLEKQGIGYIIPIKMEERYISAIEDYAQMSQPVFQQIADKALQYAITISNEKIKDTGYRKIFSII